MDLILVRGHSGSGKSTFAGKYFPDYELVEADMYFYRDTGEYKFDPKQLPDAHAWCLAETKLLLSYGLNVIVANTFSRVWEMQPYLDLKPSGVYRMRGNYDNVHGVPEAVVRAQKDRFEDFTFVKE